MKKVSLIFLTSFVFLINYEIKAQSKTFKILLGKEDFEIVNYYNGLIKLFPNNPNIEIQNKVTSEGQKMLELDFPTELEGKVDFFGVWSVFERLENGEEICIKQLFAFELNSIYESLTYFKDNYKQISSNKWEKKITDKISQIATLEINDTYATIAITIKFDN